MFNSQLIHIMTNYFETNSGLFNFIKLAIDFFLVILRINFLIIVNYLNLKFSIHFQQVQK